MKKQNLLFTFLFLSLFGAQAQEILSFASTSKEEINKSVNKTIVTSDTDMETILSEEIQRFKTFVANELEYPELLKLHGVEGEMIIRIVYDKGFEKARIIKSIDPLLDKMVLDKISKYVEGFDRTYKNAPRMVFKIPINFRLEG